MTTKQHLCVVNARTLKASIATLFMATWLILPSAAAAETAPHCPSDTKPSFTIGFAEMKNLLGEALGEAASCEFRRAEQPRRRPPAHHAWNGYLSSRYCIPQFTDGVQHWEMTPRGLVYWTGDSVEPSPDAQLWVPEEPSPNEQVVSALGSEGLSPPAGGISGKAAPLPVRKGPSPTLEDYNRGNARWREELHDVGLPVGESSTIVLPDGTLRSFLHASTQSTHGLLHDQAGGFVEFPGCVTAWDSHDAGKTFQLATPTCLFPCEHKICNEDDHTFQQQYPRVALAPDGVLYIVYEYSTSNNGSSEGLRSSTDWGMTWSPEEWVPGTGLCPPPLAGECAASWGPA
jgi:hypothetical protein